MNRRLTQSTYLYKGQKIRNMLPLYIKTINPSSLYSLKIFITYIWLQLLQLKNVNCIYMIYGCILYSYSLLYCKL